MDSYNLIDNVRICAEFVNDASQLLFYSHIPTAASALLIGLYIFYKNRNDNLSRHLALIAVFFSAWCAIDLTVWFTYDNARYLMFAWSLYGIAHILLYISAFYFSYIFITHKNAALGYKIFAVLLLLPVVFALPTNLNLRGYNTVDCIGVEGTNYVAFFLYGGLLLALLILFAFFKNYLTIAAADKKKTILFVLGMELFLLVFFATEWGIVYLVDNGYIPYSNYNIEQYGLFSMPIFVAFLAYLTVKYKLFNIKLVATQVLVVGLLFLIGSQFFFVKTTTNYILVGVTLVLATIGGYFLVRSVKKEIQQKEEIAKLAENLKVANERLKELDKMKSEFVSIASHQLRSPLTSIRGYASMLAEGSYGKLPVKANEVFQKIVESSGYMARSIEDYLNVSRIEAGNMKYEMSDFNLKEAAEKLVDELRPVALKKGLVLVFRSDCSGSCMIHADIGKTRQVIQNIIDNSMKYTPKGTVTVVAHDDVKKKKMYITVQDTGVGMSKETQEEVFNKFIRAKNAHQINVTGTGLGLYVAKKMVEEMNGRVWAESEGEGKGSTFHIEFPLLPGPTAGR